jgi:two-component system, chemotaxis family, protein-glutamate methylesterase/glutaminase
MNYYVSSNELRLFLNKSKNNKKIRVLIVDDSISMRKFFTSLLSFDPMIEVIGAAPDPFIALDMLVKLRPDVMTLDLHMPKMDGLTFLEKAMAKLPTPTIIISSFAKENSDNALRALALGAIDIFPKQVIIPGSEVETIAQNLIKKVREASSAVMLNQIQNQPVEKHEPLPSLPTQLKIQILAIAASTGGTEALKVLLSGLPSNIPGTLIIQHMAKEFLPCFADTLSRECQFEVKIAENNDQVIPGRALLAPGDVHMELRRNQNNYFIRLKDGPLIHSLRPSADPLFSSVASNVGKNAMGIILTGMGSDGAAGLFEMKKAGSFNIAQDENTCVVFGMPKEAIAKGGIDVVLPLRRIADRIIAECIKFELK